MPATRARGEDLHRLASTFRSLLAEVLSARLDPGRVFDFETDLENVAEAYAAMDERKAIKALLRVGAT